MTSRGLTEQARANDIEDVSSITKNTNLVKDEDLTKESNAQELEYHVNQIGLCEPIMTIQDDIGYGTKEDLASLRQDVQAIALVANERQAAEEAQTHARFLRSILREFWTICEQIYEQVAILVKQLQRGCADEHKIDYSLIFRQLCSVLASFGMLITFSGVMVCSAALAGCRKIDRLFRQFILFLEMKVQSSTDIVCLSESIRPQWFIPREHIRLSRVSLARDLSASTCTYRGTWDGTSVVIKSVPGENAKTRLKVEMWYKLQHPHVVRLLGACDDNDPFFVCEPASKTLSSYVFRKSIAEIWMKLYETALGLQYLHKKHGVVHGDLKCTNILVGQNNKAKITGFGFMSSNVGNKDGSTRWHSAPEIANELGGPSFESDVYSFGMCIIEAMMSRTQSGDLPESALKLDMLLKKQLIRPENMKDNQWSVVRRMCAWIPSSRPDMSAVVSMLKQIADEENVLASALETQRQMRHVDRQRSEIPPWFIDEIDIQYNSNPFNRGSFGSVHYGKLKGADVVVKCLLEENTPTAKGLQSFMKEVKVWYKLNHPHVIRLYGACDISSPPFYVCENATRYGNLDDYLCIHDANKATIWTRFHEAALGLQYLHLQNIVHGDLKCNNILVGNDKKAKISDFGLSFIRSESKTMSKQVLTGAIPWVAPECLSGAVENPTDKSDIYSLAMCIIQAFKSGSSPWGQSPEVAIKRRVTDGFIPRRPEGISDEAWTLVEKMSTSDPERRLSMDEVIKQLEQLAYVEIWNKDPCLNCVEKIDKNCNFCSMCGKKQKRND